MAYITTTFYEKIKTAYKKIKQESVLYDIKRHGQNIHLFIKVMLLARVPGYVLKESTVCGEGSITGTLICQLPIVNGYFL
jgi:hypothetical protein